MIFLTLITISRQTCNSTQYAVGSTCYSCSSNCATCSNSGQTDCLTCVANYYFSSTGYCVACPPTNSYSLYGNSLTSCLPCSSVQSNCNYCVGLVNTVKCTFCANNYADCYYQTSTNCPSGNAPCCTRCNSSCWYCNGITGLCTACIQNTYLSNGQCLNCPGNSFINQGNTNSSCTPCSSNCTTCDPSISTGTTSYCFTCPANYYVAGGICRSCPVSQTSPSNNSNPACASTSSTTCSSGQYGVGNSCYGCYATCTTCIGSSTYCTACAADYYLYSPGYCVMCMTGYTIGGNNLTTCISCAATLPNCLYCAGMSTYVKCVFCYNYYGQSYYLTNSGCTSGNTPCCAACSTSCYQCSQSTGLCTSCVKNTYFNAGSGQCINCPGNQINLDANTNTSCIICSSNCATCDPTYSSGSYCLTCPANNYLSSGVCHSCLGGQANPANNSRSSCAITCPSSCSSCSNSSVCSTCPANNYLSNGSCLSCANNTVNPSGNSNSSCSPCSSSCLTCSSTNISVCLTCSSSTSLINGSCCNPICLSCSNSTSCSTCYINYYLSSSSSGLCSMCYSDSYTPNGNSLSSCISCRLTIANCTNCQGVSNYVACTTCQTDYGHSYYLTNSSCTSGNFPCCAPCSTSCYQCDQTTGLCTSCMQNTYFSSGQCINCPGNQINLAANTSPSCIICSSNCVTCDPTDSSGSYCLTCPANNYLSSGVCQNCSAGQVNPTNNSNTYCNSCPSTCYACLSNLSCTSCKANNYLSSNGSCLSCQNNTVNP